MGEKGILDSHGKPYYCVASYCYDNLYADDDEDDSMLVEDDAVADDEEPLEDAMDHGAVEEDTFVAVAAAVGLATFAVHFVEAYAAGSYNSVVVPAVAAGDDSAYDHNFHDSSNNFERRMVHWEQMAGTGVEAYNCCTVG